MIPDKSDNIEIDDDIKLEPYELNDQFSTWDTWYRVSQNKIGFRKIAKSLIKWHSVVCKGINGGSHY